VAGTFRGKVPATFCGLLRTPLPATRAAPNLRFGGPEALVTKRTFGVLAAVVGSAVCTWWWQKQRTAAPKHGLTAPAPRGTVIFDNTPTATPETAL
jgi:hypothetical protein